MFSATLGAASSAQTSGTEELSLLRQALLIALLSIVFGAAIIALARRRVLSLRYTLGWLIIALLGLLGALLAGLVEPAARRIGVTPPVFFAMATSLVLLAIAVQLSISVSGLQRQVRRLAEAHALLADKIDADRAG